MSQAQQSTPGITRSFRGQPWFAVRGLSPGECALKPGRVLDGDFSTFLVALMTKQTFEKLDASWPTPGLLERTTWGCPWGAEHLPAHARRQVPLFSLPYLLLKHPWVGEGWGVVIAFLVIQ